MGPRNLWLHDRVSMSFSPRATRDAQGCVSVMARSTVPLKTFDMDTSDTTGGDIVGMGNNAICLRSVFADIPSGSIAWKTFPCQVKEAKRGDTAPAVCRY